MRRDRMALDEGDVVVISGDLFEAHEGDHLPESG